MGVENRQIGQASSTEATLLHNILKQIIRLTEVISVSGGGSGGGTVTSVSITAANGFAGSVATPSSTPAITISTTITGIIKGNGTAISAATVGTDYSVGTSALATGIVKSTTGTGALSIAVAGTDYLAPAGSGAALTGVYLLASGGTFTGTNTLVAGTNPLILSTGVTTGTGATAGFQIVGNSLTTGNVFDISSSSITTGYLAKFTSSSTTLAYTINSTGIVGIASSGANGTSGKTTIGLNSIITNTGSTSVNIAANFSASGANTNHAIYVTAGQSTLANGIFASTDSQAQQIYGTSDGSSANFSTGKLLAISSASTTHVGFAFNVVGTLNRTSDTSPQGAFKIVNTFNPASGANPYIGFFFNQTINQTSTASGDNTSIYAAPVYTSALGVSTFLDYVPTETSVGTHYFIRSRSTTAFSSFGGVTPSAFVTIGGGTTTKAPFKLTSGTNLTTAVAGVMEYDGTTLFFTRSGTTRESILTGIANVVSPTSPNRTIQVVVAGTTYYLAAKTTND